MVITREELIKKFWGNNVSNSRSIDMHILALRTKVFSKTKLTINTILKIGYKLTYKE
jgi:DNA-binding response OmpR family regulator